VYFDPPYQPLNGTSKFTGYTKSGFNESEQIRLADIFRKLDKTGCNVMLSNSSTDFIRKLYHGYRIEVVQAARAINCKAAGRGKIDELVILNY
jgi:DNA adenine methylase